MESEKIIRLAPLEIADYVRRKQLTAKQIVTAHLQQIDRLNPTLNCFTKVFHEQSIRDAEAIDDCSTENDSRTLLGVPVAIKDSIPVKGEVTGCGINCQQSAALEDAEIVKKLRSAGAIIIGKTTLPELAAWPFTLTANTQTRNPFALERDPGGSSGGSAVAVSQYMCSIAIGDDLGGSIRVPAACNGIIGLKPRRDRVSQKPHSQRIYGLSVYGALTRSTLDAGVALDVISGEKCYQKAVLKNPRTLKIAVSLKAPIASFPEQDIRNAIDQVASQLRCLGHQVSRVDIKTNRLFLLSFFLRYFKGISDEYNSLGRPKNVETRIKTMILLGRLIPAFAIKKAYQWQQHLNHTVSGFFDSYDVILSPITTSPPKPSSYWKNIGFIKTLIRSAKFSPYSALWNIDGAPACSVPVKLNNQGLPISVQIVAQSEQTLLSLANQFHQNLTEAE